MVPVVHAEAKPEVDPLTSGLLYLDLERIDVLIPESFEVLRVAPQLDVPDPSSLL